MKYVSHVQWQYVVTMPPNAAVTKECDLLRSFLLTNEKEVLLLYVTYVILTIVTTDEYAYWLLRLILSHCAALFQYKYAGYDWEMTG